MLKNQFVLLTKQRFLPLFITQFLGAFNDNLYKNALVVLITYILASQLKIQTELLVTLAGCLMIFPMFLFSAQAGALADKFEKAELIQKIKILEIVLMTIGSIGFITKNVTLLMVIMFFLGVQMTLFGPLKYSILPAHLKEDELVAGNGIIEMGTFIAILLGNILGVVLIMRPNGLIIISLSVIAVAIMGYCSSRFIPKAQPGAPQLTLSLNFISETIHVIQFSRQTKVLFLCILAISWFWLLGFVFLAQFPSFAKDYMGGDEDVFVLFLAIFSIGIGIGSGLCNRMLKGKIAATFVPFAAIGISIFTADLYFASRFDITYVHAKPLLTLTEFIQFGHHWRVMIDIFIISIFAGIYIVPLYAILQHRSDDAHKARMIGANNIMNALFMTVGAVSLMLLLKYKVTIPQVFLVMAVANLGILFLIRKLMVPHE